MAASLAVWQTRLDTRRDEVRSLRALAIRSSSTSRHGFTGMVDDGAADGAENDGPKASSWMQIGAMLATARICAAQTCYVVDRASSTQPECSLLRLRAHCVLIQPRCRELSQEVQVDADVALAAWVGRLPTLLAAAPRAASPLPLDQACFSCSACCAEVSRFLHLSQGEGQGEGQGQGYG